MTSSSQRQQRRSHRHNEGEKRTTSQQNKQQQNSKPSRLVAAKVSEEAQQQQPQQQQQHDSSGNNNITLSNIQSQCLTLLHAKQYKSCEILAMMELSQWNESSKPTVFISTTMEILGDCYKAKSEYHRAISYYRLAVMRCQLNCIGGASKYKRKGMTTNGSSNDVSCRNEAVLRFKEAQCLAAMGGTVAACNVLENVVLSSAAELHTFDMSMELANLYLASGRKDDAIRMYLDALELNPYALEAVEKLSMLQRDANVEEERVKCCLPSSFSELVSVYFQSNRNASSSVLLWKKINEKFPNHIHFLLNLAQAYIHVGADMKAEQVFLHIRHLDSNIITYMDQYAQLLQKRHAYHELNQLAGTLLDLDDKRTEPWTCLALYNECRDPDQALAFIDKSISCKQNSSNPINHVIKGRISLRLNRPDHAAVCFFRANEINRYDISTYEGLVESYLASDKWKEAICMAKEAITMIPKDARAITLVGIALSRVRGDVTGGKDRAKRALKKAISMDPATSTKPLLALVDIYTQEKEYDLCIDLLVKAVESSASLNNTSQSYFNTTTTHNTPIIQNQDLLHAKLADVHQLNENFMEALTSYHNALSLNPENISAQRGLERLEKVMRGLDPNSSNASHTNASSLDHDDEDDEHVTMGTSAVDVGVSESAIY